MSDMFLRPPVSVRSSEGILPQPSRRHRASASRLFGAVTRLENPDATVFLRGELDLSTVAILQGCVEQLPANVGVLVLDFARLEFIDCAGLSTVLACAGKQANHGGSLGIRSPQRAVQRVLELTGLARLVNVTDLYSNGLSSRPVPSRPVPSRPV